MFVEGFEVLAGEQLSEGVSRKAAKAQSAAAFPGNFFAALRERCWQEN